MNNHTTTPSVELTKQMCNSIDKIEKEIAFEESVKKIYFTLVTHEKPIVPVLTPEIEFDEMFKTPIEIIQKIEPRQRLTYQDIKHLPNDIQLTILSWWETFKKVMNSE